MHTSCTVEGIEKSGKGVKVKLSDGSELTAALVITATGVKANADLVEGTDIKTDQGILVDRRMQTSNPDVYAAGDVAQGVDFSTGEYQVQAIQPTATDHGRIAALNMAGKGEEHHGTLNMNVLDTVGLISCSFGLWMGVDGGDSASLYNPDEFEYINLQFDGNKLVGASAVGKTQHVGILRGLIETEVDLGEWKERLMQNPTAVMEAYVACTQELGYS